MVHDGTRAHRRGAAGMLEAGNKLNGNGQRLLQSSLPANAVLTIAFKKI